MSPQVGFDEAVAAAAKARVGIRTRLSDALNHNMVQIQQSPASAGPLLFGEFQKINRWMQERDAAERELRL